MWKPPRSVRIYVDYVDFVDFTLHGTVTSFSQLRGDRCCTSAKTTQKTSCSLMCLYRYYELYVPRERNTVGLLEHEWHQHYQVKCIALDILYFGEAERKIFSFAA